MQLPADSPAHPGIFREKRPYGLDPVVLAHLESLVDTAAAESLFVVIAFRTGPGRDEKLFEEKTRPQARRDVWDPREGPEARRAWARMWGETARRFRTRANVIGYEIMVEPDSLPHLWIPMANESADSIRSADPDTPILVGGAPWSTACTLACLAGVSTQRVVFTAHQYKPDHYSHQDPPGNSDWSVGPLTTLYEGIWGYSRNRKAPVAITEFGAHWRAPEAADYVALQIDLIERMGANHALWIWETRAVDVGYDEMDFRKDPGGELARVIRQNWAANAIRP